MCVEIKFLRSDFIECNVKCGNTHVAECNCHKDCPNHGKCCDCVMHHKNDIGNLPFCLRPKE